MKLFFNRKEVKMPIQRLEDILGKYWFTLSLIDQLN